MPRDPMRAGHSTRLTSTRPPPSPDALDWDDLSDPAQLAIARQALQCAAEKIAGQAEALAGEIELGVLDDRGGPDALRLLAAVVRFSSRDQLVPTN